MIYILGTERSASTWVANILDHHPCMDVYMEPLSSFNSRFKDWPDRFTPLKNPEERADEFQHEFDILTKHRRLFLTRMSDSPQAWQTDLRWAQFFIQKKVAPGFIKDFLESNFHRKDRTIPLTKQTPLQMVIKEVRLNFNASLIPWIDNNPKVLVTIREMASCVRSMMKLIEQGNLVDLGRDLGDRYGKADAKTLCRYWTESYTHLIETLGGHQIPFEIVSHTELLEKPIETTENVFQFLDLPVSVEVKNYLEISNQKEKGAHSTRRNRHALLEQIQEDRNYMYPLIRQELEEIRQHPVLKKFVSDT